MSERSERFRAGAKRRRDAGFIDGSTDGEGLCDDIEALEAKVAAGLAKHRKRTDGSPEPYCGTCFQAPYGHAPWPCPSVLALGGTP